MGYDSGRLFEQKESVYFENSHVDRDAALRRLIKDESLRFGLSSSETAWVAVRSEKGNPIRERVIVANALPDGWVKGFESRVLNLCAGDEIMRLFDDMPDIESLDEPDGLRNCESFTRIERDSKPVYKGLGSSIQYPEFVECFHGIPAFRDKEAVLYDSEETHDVLPPMLTLLEFQMRQSPLGALKGLSLLLFVDDMVLPAAKVSLADLSRQGGRRPLNISLGRSAHIRLVLLDEEGVWAKEGPIISLALK